MSNFIQITPFMHVPHLETALKFFNDILGLKPSFVRAITPTSIVKPRACASWNKAAKQPRLPVLAASLTTLTYAMLTHSTPSSSPNSIP